MTVPKPDFTVDDLVECLREEAGEVGEGLTTKEIASRIPYGVSWVRRRLGELKDEGRLVVNRKEGTNLAGYPCWKPAYLLKDKKDKKDKKSKTEE